MTPVRRDMLDALPHRRPFRFLSEVRALCPQECGEAVWHVGGDEWFLEGHFPGRPIVPGMLITEALAQLSGLVGLYPGNMGNAEQGADLDRAPQIGKLAHVDIRFKDSVIPPAEITLASRLERRFGALLQFQVQARCSDRVVARGRLTLASAEPQKDARP